MKSQGLQANQQVTFLSDGADDVRELPLYLSPESEHWLDWFHVAMRLRVMGQIAKGLVNEQNMMLAQEPLIEAGGDVGGGGNCLEKRRGARVCFVRRQTAWGCSIIVMINE